MNEINLCGKVTTTTGAHCAYHYEHSQGKLIYAIIKEDGEMNTRSIAANIISQMYSEQSRSKVFAQ